MQSATRYEVSKNLLGAYVVKYPCPHCGEKLSSALKEAGTQDNCPNCYRLFVVPGAEAVAQVAAMRRAAAERKEQVKAELRQEKQQRKNQREKERARAREEAAAHRAAELWRAEEARQARTDREESTSEEEGEAKRRSIRPLWLSGGAVALATILLVVYLNLRGSELRSKLDQCESSGVVNARVSYSGLIGTEVVIFDLRDGGSAGARRIDPVHLLMQFSGKLDLYAVDRILLARNGTKRFYIAGSDMRRLAQSYAGGGRIWAFNNLPARVRRMDGTQAFDEWTGGWLGVLQKQAEDLNRFITDWTGYGSAGTYSAAPTYSSSYFDSDATLRSRVRETLQDMEDNVPDTLESMEDSLPAVMADMEAQMMKDAAKYGLSPSEVRAQLREIEAGAREQIRGMEDDVRDQIRGMEDEVIESLKDSGM